MRDSWLPSDEQQRGAKLLYLIMNEQIRPHPLKEYVCKGGIELIVPFYSGEISLRAEPY